MPIVYFSLPVLFAIACYGEVKHQRIPNWLTISGMLLGVGSALIEGGMSGALNSLLALAIAGGIFLPFCLVGVVGGGDMKLMAATGAILGYPLILRALTATCMAGGLLAIALMAWHGILLSTFLNAFKILIGMPRRQKGLSRPVMVPYGIAIAVGTLAAIFAG